MKIIFATSNRGKLREASEILGAGFDIVSPAELGIFDDVPETGDSFAANSMQKAAYLFKKCAIPCFADDSGLEVDALGGAPGIYTGRYADQAWEQERAAGMPDISAPGADHVLAGGSVIAAGSVLRGASVQAAGSVPTGGPAPEAGFGGGGGPVPAVAPAPAAPNHHFDAGIRRLLREMAALPEGTPRTARFRCVVTLILDEGTTAQFEGSVEGRIAARRSGGGGFGYDPVFIPDAYPDRTLAELGEEVKNSISHRGEALRKMASWLRDRGF